MQPNTPTPAPNLGDAVAGLLAAIAQCDADPAAKKRAAGRVLDLLEELAPDEVGAEQPDPLDDSAGQIGGVEESVRRGIAWVRRRLGPAPDRTVQAVREAEAEASRRHSRKVMRPPTADDLLRD